MIADLVLRPFVCFGGLPSCLSKRRTVLNVYAERNVSLPLVLYPCTLPTYPTYRTCFKGFRPPILLTNRYPWHRLSVKVSESLSNGPRLIFFRFKFDPNQKKRKTCGGDSDCCWLRVQYSNTLNSLTQPILVISHVKQSLSQTFKLHTFYLSYFYFPTLLPFIILSHNFCIEY